jgi:hypothetical protein
LPPFPEYDSGLLAAHCNKRVVDSNDNGVPGGNYGVDEDLLIAAENPVRIEYIFGVIRPDARSSIRLTFSGEGDPPSYPTDTGLPTNCVAAAGGKWVVAGGVDAGETGISQAAYLVATEAGYTWKVHNPSGTSAIITLTGGALDAGL